MYYSILRPLLLTVLASLPASLVFNIPRQYVRLGACIVTYIFRRFLFIFRIFFSISRRSVALAMLLDRRVEITAIAIYILVSFALQLFVFLRTFRMHIIFFVFFSSLLWRREKEKKITERTDSSRFSVLNAKHRSFPVEHI